MLLGKFLCALAGTLSLASGSLAASIKGTPFTFTGTVANASSACPYAAKAQVSGYTLINISPDYSTYPPTKTIIEGPALIFSPVNGATKIVLKIDNLPTKTASIKGNVSVVFLPGTDTTKGTYKGSMNFVDNTHFSLKLTPTFTTATGKCTTTYDITFSKGLAAKLFNLL